MSDIFRYIQKYQNRSLNELPFTHVDALIFAQLSYIDYKELRDVYKKPKIKQIAHLLDLQEVEAGYLSGKDNRRLLLALAHAKRYQNIQLINETKIINEETCEQFHALTFAYKQMYYIVFEGTDTSILGWKEDLHMLVYPVVPAQQDGVRYLEQILKYPFKKAIVIGHSKGGSIATYASLHVNKKVQRKIKAIYNFDGPALQSVKSLEPIQNRYYKFVTQATFFGLFFENEENYRIVKSNERWLLQHNLYTWMIEDTDFIYLDQLDSRFYQINRKARDALLSLTHQERETFIVSLSEILDDNQITDVAQLTDSWPQTSIMLLRSLTKVDKEKRDAIMKTVGLVVSEMLRR